MNETIDEDVLLFLANKEKESKPSPNSKNGVKRNSNESICFDESLPLSLASNNGSQSLASQTEVFETTQVKRQKFLQTLIQTPTQENNNNNTMGQTNNHLNQSNDSSDDYIMENVDNLVPEINEKNTFYGLPLKVKDLLKTLRGIGCLYEWQDELLKIMQEKDKKESLAGKINLDKYNLLYLSPTSGGKTLVAEILILQCLLLQKKNCIFIMPYVAIVQEKVELLLPFGEKLNFYVEEYANTKGVVPPVKRQVSRNKPTLYICTMEKAHSLINSLIETERLNEEVGMVVADELHMIGDGQRGAIYEILLSKIKFCSKIKYQKCLNEKSNKLKNKLEPPIRIVATTATLSNKDELALFLNAYLYERTFRPVELKEHIMIEKQIFEVDKQKLKNFVEDREFVDFKRKLDLSNYTKQMLTEDVEGLIALVKEVFDPSPEGVKESCLIFCATKDSCKNVAKLVARHLPPEFKTYKRELKLALFREIKECNANNCDETLRATLPFGIAYHHSGLTNDERNLIETAYKEGVLFLLTCTSTLAAGVNLPAKRVIIRAPMVGRDFMMANQYKQMIGRAGRAGLCDYGESFLIYSNKDKAKVKDLISLPMKRCESYMNVTDFKTLGILILSLVGLRLAHYGESLLAFFKQTLFYIQNKDKYLKPLRSIDNENNESVPADFGMISEAVKHLLKKGFLMINTDEYHKDTPSTPPNSLENINDYTLYISQYKITSLGLAAIKGSIDLDVVDKLYSDLKNGLKNMVLSNYLHLLYLCTPYDIAEKFQNLNDNTFYHKYMQLNEDELKCAQIIGVTEQDLINKTKLNKASKMLNETVYKRFYITLIINQLWKKNKSVWEVGLEFEIDRGQIQNIMTQSATFSSNILHFCEHLEDFWPYKKLLEELMKRLQYNCSAAELIPLLELDSVKQSRATQLYNAGFTDMEKVASAKPQDMIEKIKFLPLDVAKKIIKSANRIIREKAEVLQDEAQHLLQNLETI